MAEYKLDNSKSEELQEKLKAVGPMIEDDLNEIIWNDGANAAMQYAIGFMPRSKRKKKHAKDSKPLQVGKPNLGFRMFEKKNFAYLVFPNLGIGFRQRESQEFMERGIEEAAADIEKWVLELLNDKLGLD